MAGKKRKSAEMGRVDVPARRAPRRGLGVAALESIRAQLETAESFYMFTSLATAAATAAPPPTPPLPSLLAGHVVGVRFDPYVGNGAAQRDYYPHYFGGAEQSNTTPWHAVNISTSSKIVRLLRDAGALHMRIASPPVVGPCLYGIDTPSDGELISNRMDLEGVRREIGSDSLAFLSLDKLHDIYGEEAGDYCDACFSRKYPVLPTLPEPAAEFDEEE